MLDAGLICSRFLHYASLMVLFGVSLFPRYAYPTGLEPLRLARWRQKLEVTATVGVLISGVLWLVFVIGNMAGTLSAATDRDAVWSVVRDTDFGRVWSARLLLTFL